MITINSINTLKNKNISHTLALVLEQYESIQAYNLFLQMLYFRPIVFLLHLITNLQRHNLCKTSHNSILFTL